MSFDPQLLALVLRENARRENREQSANARVDEARAKAETFQRDQQSAQRERAEGLMEKAVELGGDPEALVGLIGPNALPPGRIKAYKELSRMKREQKKREKEPGPNTFLGQLRGTPESILPADRKLDLLRQNVERQATQPTTTQQELGASGLPGGEQQQLLQQILRRRAEGDPGTEITLPDGTSFSQGRARGLSGTERVRMKQRLGDATNTLSRIDDLITKVENAPDLVGFSQTIRNTVGKGLGFFSGIDRAIGTNFKSVIDSMKQDLENEVARGGAEPAILEAVNEAEEIAKVEFDEMVMAFQIAKIFRPNSRASIEAVRMIQRRLNFADMRGEDFVVRRLEAIRETISEELETQQAIAVSEGIKFKAPKPRRGSKPKGSAPKRRRVKIVPDPNKPGSFMIEGGPASLQEP